MSPTSVQEGVLLKPRLEGLQPLSSGKVREMYDVGDRLLIVTTDRISAFDVVLPVGIPQKGRVLNRLSEFWFVFLGTPHHMITCDVSKMPGAVRRHRDLLRGRSMLVKKAKPFPIECVARGYLAGSGWKDYQETGAVCGHKLPQGMVQAQKLPRPIFTPATKAATGHDQNIDLKTAYEIVGKKTADELRRRTLDLYSRASSYAEKRGILLADTKFEFGEVDGKIILIDEVLTPDSSRFWPKSEYRLGTSPPSFDKQFVRDYLESVAWDKTPPAPPLPDDVVRRTSEKYLEAYRLLVGKPLRQGA
ncbi:MAG: phosphoribosylaminoimidazolesuccinocarboxamide synthase [Planctomycetes bacterium]|nr:phosphoribosylaminoimidazolesuccinocarboxamide synthase [Planctomycetota bacterium]